MSQPGHGWPLHLVLELKLMAFVALAAVDVHQFGSSQRIITGATVAIGLLTTLNLATSPYLNGEAVRRSPMRWFVLWIGWAAGTGLLAPDGPSPFLTTALFAVCAAGSIVVYGRSGELGIARVIGGGFVTFVALSLTCSALGVGPPMSRSGRLTMLSLEANQLARFAGLATIAAMFLIWFGLRHREKFWLLAGSVLFGLGAIVMIEVQSRTGSLALIAGTAAFVAALIPRSRRPAAALAAIAVTGIAFVVAAALAGGPSNLIDRAAVNTTRSTREGINEIGSLNGRINIWPEIYSVAMTEPVTGFGLGTDQDIVVDMTSTGELAWEARHTHNLGLQLLLTTGVVGLALVTFGIVSCAARVFAEAYKPLAPGLLCLMLIDGISEAAIRVPSFGWFALVSVAAITSGRVIPARFQLTALNTVETRSSISSTARS